MADRPTKFPEGAASGDGVGGTLPSAAFPPSGKPKRKAIPPHMLVTVAILQAVDGGLRCPLCTLRITTNHKRILEHLTPVAFGGKNEIDNLRFVHAECAAKKTNGSTATSANGDLHKIAKAKRLAHAQAEHEAVVARVMTRKPGKIKGAGFPKGWRKRMNGKVERV